MKRIGLLGGSFNPAHVGHRRISLAAMDALGLDEVWWLVSPGNPLKAHAKDMALLRRPLRLRARSWRGVRASASATSSGGTGTRYTVDTVAQTGAPLSRTTASSG